MNKLEERLPESRLERLEEFWRRMRRKELWGLSTWPGLSDTTSYWSHSAWGNSRFLRAQSARTLGRALSAAGAPEEIELLTPGVREMLPMCSLDKHDHCGAKIIL
jgi:hypothetical protein